MNVNIFIDNLFKRAKVAGFESYEAYYSEGESFRLMIFEGKVDDYNVTNSEGLSFRGILNGKMGYSFTEILDEDAIDMLVSKAVENARIIENEDEEFIFGGGDICAVIDAWSTDLAMVKASDKIKLALKLERVTKSYSKEIKSIGYCLLSTSGGSITIRNSKGLNRSFKENMGYALIMPIVNDGDNVTNSFCYKIFNNIDELDVKELAGKAVEKALNKRGAKPCKTGTYNIIIENEASADLLSSFLSIFNAESAQKGLSLLKGKIGTQIAADIVTIVDDPHSKIGYASQPFDAEGVATIKKEVVSKGNLTTFLHNLKTAAIDNVKSTGNASKGSFKSPVDIAPSNFYIQPTKTAITEMMSIVGNGILITELEGLHAGVNAVSGDFALSAKGFMIEDGKKTWPVEQITIAGNFFELLQSITCIGDDLDFSIGGASIGSPSIIVKDVSVTGK